MTKATPKDQPKVTARPRAGGGGTPQPPATPQAGGGGTQDSAFVIQSRREYLAALLQTIGIIFPIVSLFDQLVWSSERTAFSQTIIDHYGAVGDDAFWVMKLMLFAHFFRMVMNFAFIYGNASFVEARLGQISNGNQGKRMRWYDILFITLHLIFCNSIPYWLAKDAGFGVSIIIILQFCTLLFAYFFYWENLFRNDKEWKNNAFIAISEVVLILSFSIFFVAPNLLPGFAVRAMPSNDLIFWLGLALGTVLSFIVFETITEYWAALRNVGRGMLDATCNFKILP